MREFAASRPPVAKGREGLTYLGPAQARIVINAVAPLQGPAQLLDQFARQAKGKVEATDPFAPQPPPVPKTWKALAPFEPPHHHPLTGHRAQRQHERLAARGTAGEITAE